MERVLRWEHESAWRREWTLRERDRVLLRLRQRGVWGLDADLEDAAGRRLRVVDEAGRELASMRMGWRGQGEPETPDGRRHRWEAERGWGTRWGLRDEAGGLVALVDVGCRWGFEANVRLGDALPPEETLLALLALGWLCLVYTLQAAFVAAV